MTPLTVNDCNKYIMMIRIEYPNAFPIQARDEEERGKLYTMLVASWYRQLEKYPKELCDKAVMDALGNAREGRYPRIGDVKYQAEKLISAYEKSDGELWAEIVEAVRLTRKYIIHPANDYIYFFNKYVIPNEEIVKIYEGLSPETKEFLGNAEGLKTLARQDTLEYEKGRFLRVMPTLKERSKTRRDMPENLAGLIQGMTEQFALGCDGTKLLQGE